MTQYDLAFSFAGEQRDYVERTVRACQSLGIDVFYDKDANNDWWGKNFIREQRNIYSSQTRFFVPFISAEYLQKSAPMDEFSAAMMTAVKKGDGYILPVLMGDVRVPPDLMHPHIHYLKSDNFTPEQLADEFAAKLKMATQQGQAVAPIGAVVQDALQYRMPKIIPDTWSKYEELDKLYEYLRGEFEQAGNELRGRGLACSVRARADDIVVRVERAGQTVAGLDIRRGTQMGDDKITWSVGWRNMSSNSFNGWATPVFDKERQLPTVEISDLTAMSRGANGTGETYESLFQHLWGLLIDQIER